MNFGTAWTIVRGVPDKLRRSLAFTNRKHDGDRTPRLSQWAAMAKRSHGAALDRRRLAAREEDVNDAERLRHNPLDCRRESELGTPCVSARALPPRSRDATFADAMPGGSVETLRSFLNVKRNNRGDTDYRVSVLSL
jgi:hypothetical protein